MISKLVFVDHPLHEKTGSSNFIKEILKQKYKLVLIYFDQFNDDKVSLVSKINDEAPEGVIFWQNFPYGYSTQIDCKNLTFFPMFDDYLITGKYMSKKEFKRIKIICFSFKLFTYFKQTGYKNLYYFQYFPINSSIENFNKQQRSLFYWKRSSDISTDQLITICNQLRIERIHIHDSLNTGLSFEIKKKTDYFELSESNWFSDSSSYLNLIKDFTFFLAPRKYEGIGLSFLEAMANGAIVIGFDFPTLNEYVTHEETGLLLNHEGILHLSKELDISKIQQESQSKAELLSQDWIASIPRLIEIVQYPIKKFYFKFL